MPSITDVAANAKKLKEHIADTAGVAPEDVNDKNLTEVGKALEGSKVAVAQGVAPTQVPIEHLKAAAAPAVPAAPAAGPVAKPAADDSTPEELSKQQKIAYAIAAIAPTLLGAAFGGSRGGAIGAQTSEKAVGQMDADYRAGIKKKEDDKDKAAALTLKQREVAKDELKATTDNKFKTEELQIKRDEIKQRMQLLKQKRDDQVTKAGLALTPGEKARDQKFGKEYEESILSGGMPDALKNLQALDDVYAKLTDPKGPNVTGPVTGRIPFKTLWNPESVDVQENIENVIQRSMRPILGAQFTENEGVRLIKRAYNPNLDEATNAKRVKALADSLRTTAMQKLAASEYFEEHGTLKGFKGTEGIDPHSLFDVVDGKAAAPRGISNPMLDKANADAKRKPLDQMSDQELDDYEKQLTGAQ